MFTNDIGADNVKILRQLYATNISSGSISPLVTNDTYLSDINSTDTTPVNWVIPVTETTVNAKINILSYIPGYVSPVYELNNVILTNIDTTMVTTVDDTNQNKDLIDTITANKVDNNITLTVTPASFTTATSTTTTIAINTESPRPEDIAIRISRDLKNLYIFNKYYYYFYNKNIVTTPTGGSDPFIGSSVPIKFTLNDIPTPGVTYIFEFRGFIKRQFGSFRDNIQFTDLRYVTKNGETPSNEELYSDLKFFGEPTDTLTLYNVIVNPDTPQINTKVSYTLF